MLGVDGRVKLLRNMIYYNAYNKFVLNGNVRLIFCNGNLGNVNYIKEKKLVSNY